MRFLVVGSGQFALNWIFSQKTSKFENIVIGRSKKLKIPNVYLSLDLTSIKEIKKHLQKYQPDVVINAVALTDVDLCESNPEMAKTSNEIIPLNLALTCFEVGIPLVHISTDHFSSVNSVIRDENVKPIPINVYGKTKVNAESSIIRNTEKFIIVRTNFFGFSTLYSTTALMEIIKKLNQKEIYLGADDIMFNPVSIEFLIESVIQLLEKNYNGLINISSDSCISKFEFAREVAQILDIPADRVSRVSQKELDLKTLRPEFMCLHNSKLKNILKLTTINLANQLEQSIKDIELRAKLEKAIKW